ncbi:aldo/keto reductase [Candidatus Nitronereus thalassa]|uniref:Aldo/keto reductase n=1 Tax=Candidatus Nitronereus thalassa TaxID=3020898 RepID=A0ABU3K639_9BACT|nr:aldo/keto reductase [Candidatus Nitronereus thalassa]MDT7041851.1 aldo/keto reductase [Candidatus Nitronereus thalassa]
MNVLNRKIEQKALGRTGIMVSEIALGTVELGLDYGIPMPGAYGRPETSDAVRLISQAAESGINLFDTAPNYGTSESLLGSVLNDRPDCVIATKVNIPVDANRNLRRGQEFEKSINESLDNSRRQLRRDTLDIVQIHNATVEVLESNEWQTIMARTTEQGKVRVWGASVYTEEEALSAIRLGLCSLIQVPYNLLDQKMAERVFPLAEQAGVAIMVRSVFLKGVLTEKAQWLPATLEPLKNSAEKICGYLEGSWRDVSRMALRFCVSTPGVTTALVGLRTQAELQETLDSIECGPLPTEEFYCAQSWGLSDEPLLNPSSWPE